VPAPDYVNNGFGRLQLLPLLHDAGFALCARRPPAFVEPGAIFDHFRALRRRRMAATGRRFLASLGCAPT
jgi:hypothetical protein